LLLDFSYAMLPNFSNEQEYIRPVSIICLWLCCCFEIVAYFIQLFSQGMRMLFRDGRVRGVGIVTGIPAI